MVFDTSRVRFPTTTIITWQKYVAPMVMTDRQENLEANYLNFIKRKRLIQIVNCCIVH
jgi:hypothetical protein